MSATATVKKPIPETGIILTGDSLSAFKKAMKIAYYKDLLKLGIISNAEFSVLMQMQNK